MNGEDYDEDWKIDIANAMSRGELGVKGEDYDYMSHTGLDKTTFITIMVLLD